MTKHKRKACIFDADKIRHMADVRQAHLDSLGLPLEGKRVLEVGAGIGQLTRWFEDRGCEIISTDGNLANVTENLRRHPERLGRVFVADLEQVRGHNWLGIFDVVFCYGVFYHLGKPARCLLEMARLTSELFLLETRVNPTDNGGTNVGRERPGRDKAIRGRNCKPARDWVMQRLRREFGYAYVTRQQPNHRFFPTKWPANPGHCRAVFVGSHAPLNLPSLSDKLLNKQERYT